MLPPPALACSAKNYTPAYPSYLSACAAAGNAEAAFLLGMVEFYCLERVVSGMKWLVQAAKAGHPAALHSLSIIHFNGSGLPSNGAEEDVGAETDGGAERDGGRRKLRGNRKVGMGMLLCVAAAKAGHPDALRELGLCLQDGFGIKRNVAQGRLLLVEANLRELANSGDEVAEAVGGVSCVGAEDVGRHGSGVQDGYSESEEEVGSTSRARLLGGSKSEGSTFSLGTESAAMNTLLQHTSRLLQRASRATVKGVTVTEGDKQETLEITDEERLLARAVLADGGILGCCTGEGKSVQIQPPPMLHANAFLVEWTALRGERFQESERHVCGNARCGRVELRKGEFRCCAACEEARYCSRACQVVDWRFRHVVTCQPCSRD
ncbi:hypothetical protein CLOP_g1627 [Closterium sp. NIES-67]|nr:hypothetical protein CLOP_g1627 [Closterium sp. NIES-67]